MFTSMDSHYMSSPFSNLSMVTYLCLAAIGMGSIFSVEQYHIRTNSLELGLLVFICIALLLCTQWWHVLFGTLVFFIPTVTIFGGDQSPSNPRSAHWMTFLNQETGVMLGSEKLAKSYNSAVVYGRINKEKRGYYSFEFFEITDAPNETAEGEITEKATRLLEKDIREYPQYWLWTHRRWKHNKPANK